MSFSNMDVLYDFLDQAGIHYERNASLAKKTWIHRGGSTCWISVTSADELKQLCAFLYKNHFEFLTVGHTSNLYIKNTCNPQIVVSTLRCNHFDIGGDVISCEAGASVIKLSKAAVDAGIAGFEYLTGLPGTVGGALCNNSSCGKYSIADLLIYAEYIDGEGNEGHLAKDDFNYAFRTSDFKSHKKKGVITKVYLKKEFGEKGRLIAISRENEEQRKHYLGPGTMNLGCTVNRCFINGSMPFKYRVRQSLYTKALSFFVKEEFARRKMLKEHILKITGYSDLNPYISDYSMIIYTWKDDKADLLFPRYLDFMDRIYRTDRVEIEILE